MNIEGLRKTYQGFSDDEIVTALQQTKYSDFSREEVAAAIGIKPPTAGQQLASGFKRSFAEIPGLAAGVGAYAADVVGADETRDKLLGYAQKRQEEMAQTYGKDASSISDAWDGKTSWIDFLANASGYVAGQAVQAVATGGLGALGAKLIAKKGAQELAEAAAAKAIAGGASEEVAKRASIEALEAAITKASNRGAVAGAGAHNLMAELGSIYPEAVGQAQKEGRELDAGDMFRIFGAASVAAGVDTAGEAIMASRILRGSNAPSASVAGRAAREVPAGMARESGTEAIQTGIERFGAGQEILDEEGRRAIIDAAGIGLVGGGLGGGAASFRQRQDTITTPTEPEQPAPTEQQPGALGYSPDPYISFPDGTVGKRADVENYIANLPEEQRSDMRARLMGLGPQEATDPIHKILDAGSVDEAAAAAAEAIKRPTASNDPEAVLKELTGSTPATFERRMANITLDAEAARAEAQKAVELDAIQASVAPMEERQAQAQAVERAAQVEGPSAMQLALQRAMPAPAPVAAPVAPAPTPITLDTLERLNRRQELSPEESTRLIEAGYARAKEDGRVALTEAGYKERGRLRREERSTTVSSNGLANDVSIKTAPVEGLLDGGGANSKDGGKLLEGQAKSDKPFSELDVPSKRVVLGAVLRSIQNDQIRQRVVQLIPVDVMDLLIGKKLSPEVLLHDGSVFKNALSVLENDSVPANVNVAADRFVRTVASVATELGSPLANENAGSNEFTAAVDANQRLVSGEESALAGVGAKEIPTLAGGNMPVGFADTNAASGTIDDRQVTTPRSIDELGPSASAIGDSPTILSSASKKPKFETVQNPTGTLTVQGDPEAIRAALPQFKGIASKAGVVYGVKDAAKVQESLGIKPDDTKLSAVDSKVEIGGVTYERDTEGQRDADKFNARLKRAGFTSVLTAVRPGNASTAQRFAGAVSDKVFGRRVVWVDFEGGKPLFNGAKFDDTPDVIYLYARSKKPALAVAGHELLHSLRQDRQDLYKDLVERLKPQLQNQSEFAERLRKKDPRAAADPDKTEEELVADIVGDRFTEPEFWKELAEDRPEGFKKIANAVRQFLDNLIDRITQLRPFGTDLYLRDLKAARSAVVEAMREYSVSQKEKTGKTDGDFEFSPSDQTDTPAFKRWFGDSVVTKNGKVGGEPLVVYHGTPAADLSVFDIRRVGTNGRAEGPGFYFTTAKEIAEGYGQRGKTLEVYLSIKKPLAYDAKPFSQTQVRKLLTEIAKAEAEDSGMDWRDGFLSNYVDTYSGSIDSAIRDAARSFDGDDTALDQVSGIIGAGVGAAIVNTGLTRALGYDGYFSRGFSGAGQRGGDIWVAMRSEQIKSATENAGTFDQAHPDIRFSAIGANEETMGKLTPAQLAAATRIIGDGAKKTWGQWLTEFKADLGLKARQALVDQFAAIKEYDQRAYMQARMSKGSDGALEATMLYGKPFMNGGVPDVKIGEGGFAEILASLKGEHQRFLLWIAAQRAERLKAVGLENLFSNQDIATLKTLNQGKFADGSSREAAFLKAQQKLNEFNDSILKIAEESGLIDPEARKLFKDTPYVPFYRVMEEGEMSGPRFSSGLVNQKAFKTLKGGTNQLNGDLLSNVLLNWSHLFKASANNRAAVATMKAAVEAGTAYEVPSGTKGSVRVMEDGQAKHYSIEDPYLLQAVSALNYVSPQWIRPLAVAKKWLTAGVTANPAFKIRNLIRDSISAIAQSDLSPNALENLSKGWQATRKDSQTYASMMAGGGLMRFGTVLEGNRADRAHDLIHKLGGEVLDEKAGSALLRKLGETWDAYQELGDRAEQINRAALYERLKAKGYSHEEASFMSRDLLDFSMSGGSHVVRFLTQTVPFLNARLQGLYKLGRAANENPQRFWAVAGSVALASIALWAAYSDNEDWKKREDWDRDTYWWFKIGDKAFRIPKPFEIGAMGTVAERTFELMFDKEMDGKRYGKRLSSMLFQTFAMDPTPQLLKPLLDVYANKDSFSDRPIESEALRKLRPQDRADQNTSPLANLLGQIGLPNPAELAKGHWADLSPKQIDYLLRAYFGWYATAAATTSGMIQSAVSDVEKPDLKVKDWFLAGNFVESLPSGSSRYVTAMYEASRDIEQAYSSWRAAIKSGDFEEAKGIFESERSKILKYKLISDTKEDEAKINANIKRIQNAKDLDGATKRKLIDQYEQQRDIVARRLAML